MFSLYIRVEFYYIFFYAPELYLAVLSFYDVVKVSLTSKITRFGEQTFKVEHTF